MDAFKISQTSLTVCKQYCYLDCESTGLKPVMDCKIPFIYIAETQRSRMIMSKTRSVAISSDERQDSTVRFRACGTYNLNI